MAEGALKLEMGKRNKERRRKKKEGRRWRFSRF